MRAGTSLRALAVWMVVASGSGCGDDDDDDLDTAIAQCEQLAEATCRQAYAECGETLARAIFSGTSTADDCPSFARAECAPSSDGDGCEPPVPSQSLVDACESQIEAAECDDLDTVFETGACGDLDDQLECEDPDGRDGGTPTDGGVPGDGGDADDAGADDGGPVCEPPAEIHTEACVAAVQQTCTVLERCDEKLDFREAISRRIANCDDRVAGATAEVEEACQEYLEALTATCDPMACWLNAHSAAEVQACGTGQSCDEQFVLDLLDAIDAFLAGKKGSGLELAALLTPILENCDMLSDPACE